MLTKEEKALAIARAEGWDYAPNNILFVKDNNLILIRNLIELYTSFNGLMPIVERINKETINDCELISIDYSQIHIAKWIKDDKDEQIQLSINFWLRNYDSLLDALLDAVYYVLVESKELK